MAVRLLVVGAGTGRGQTWLATISKVRDWFDFVALCEAIPERAEENSKRWRVPAYTNLLEALDAAQPQAVFCAAPPDLNHAVVAIAARHGCHVATEIPVAPSRRILDFILSEISGAGVKLEVAENVYRWATERFKQKIIASGILGRPLHARLRYSSGPYHGINAVRYLVGSHPAWAVGFSGKIDWPWYLYYTDENLPDRHFEAAIIGFQNGVHCLYEGYPAAALPSRWQLECSDGVLLQDAILLGDERKRFEFATEYCQINGRRVLDSIRIQTDPPIVWENPYKHIPAEDNDEVARIDILRSLYEAAAHGKPTQYPPEEAWIDQGAWVGLRQSALAGGQRTDLPIRQPTDFGAQLEKAYQDLYGCIWDDVETLITRAVPRGGVRWHVARQL